MTEIRPISDDFWVSPQISVADVAAAADNGVTLIVNNRPEDESADQTPGSEIADAAARAGIAYLAIPVTHAGFSEPQVDAMARAIQDAPGRVLAYCRSGTRSTLLWALAEARAGADKATIVAQAGQAGYDVAPIQPLLDMFAAKHQR